MTAKPLLVVILAAGKGVRMRSSIPKVLHAIAGRSMLAHVLATVRAAGADKVALVVAPGMEAVCAEAGKASPGIETYEQATQGGTAHAVLAARAALERHQGDVIVLFANSPLVEPATLRRMIAALDAGAEIAVLGFAPTIRPATVGWCSTDRVACETSASTLMPASRSGGSACAMPASWHSVFRAPVISLLASAATTPRANTT